MGAPFKYSDLASRLADARSWASNVTEGNRCAMVVGVALKLQPKGSETTFQGLPDAKAELRNMPFLSKFFVKADDLALRILDAWGPATVRAPGQEAASSIQDRKGVVYLQDCWRTPTEKMNKLLFDVDVKSGDHVDLWNGATLEIYPSRTDSVQLLKQARAVFFWEAAG